MKEADDWALAREAKKQAAVMAAEEKKTATLLQASASVGKNTSLPNTTTGDSKKGANLFKVSYRPFVFSLRNLANKVQRHDALNAIPSSSLRVTRLDPTYTASSVARTGQVEGFSYTDANKQKGITWEEGTLVRITAYLSQGVVG